ncbi:MAG: sigma-54-dependent transcriptional regulator [Pyrinomonadaceae bacterium]
MVEDNPVISIVDDDESVRQAIARLINSVGLNVETFASAEDFLSSSRVKDPACLVLDLRLPGMSGLELQSQLFASGSRIPILFISGHGDSQARAKALGAGAVGFLQKPFNEQALFGALRPFVGDVLVNDAPEIEPDNSPGPPPSDRDCSATRSKRVTEFPFDLIIGQSQVMQDMMRLARKVAESQVSSVLLQGPSGTGKDLVAKAIHYASNRADHPFIAINCAALPANLIESELFGHEKGAFTDARTRKEGLLEQANGGGTIFLDEISEMDINLQAKLLRVLEEGSFRRVGGVKDVPFNARVIAASNRDLKRESEIGRFRLDLYYRLAVIEIEMPPLSERGDDVLLIANHFIKCLGNGTVKGLTPEAARAFKLYHWPGNVRELRNAIERAMVLEDGDMISTQYLPREIVPDMDPKPIRFATTNVIDADGSISLPRDGIALSVVETVLLREALARAGGNQTRAAELLGLTRDQFRYRLKKINDQGQGQLPREMPKKAGLNSPGSLRDARQATPNAKASKA